MQKTTLAIFLLLLCINPVFAEDMNFASQIAHGGISIFAIIALSILALSISIERLIHFRKKYIVPNDLVTTIKPLWENSEYEKIQTLLSNNDSILAKAISFMLAHRNQPFQFVSAGVADIASIELRKQQHKAYMLAIVATVAPILGLLGTVVGMIEAFHVIASSDGLGNPTLLADGISKALINTATGLSVALPSLGMHHFFKNRATAFGLSLESTLNELMNQWFAPKIESPTQEKIYAS